MFPHVAQVGNGFPSAPRGVSGFGGALPGSDAAGAPERVRSTRVSTSSLLTCTTSLATADGRPRLGVSVGVADLVALVLPLSLSSTDNNADVDRVTRFEGVIGVLASRDGLGLL